MGAMAQSPAAYRRVLLVVAVPTVAFLVFAVWLLAGWGGPSTIRAVHVAGALGFPSFAAVSTAVAARRGSGRQRYTWTVLTVGLAGLELSAISVVYHRFLRGNIHTLYPMSGMIGFLAFPVVACVAFVVFPAGYPGLARLRMVLDAAIVAGALFVVAWVTLLRDVYSSTAVSGVDQFVSIACPASGIVTVTLTLLAIVRAPTRWRPSMRLMAMGLTLIAASGSAYVYLFARHIFLWDSPLGLGWPAGLVLVGLAALTSPPDPPETSPERSALLSVPAPIWLPYVPLVIAGGLVLTRFRSCLASDPALAAVAWLIGAVLARQFLLIAENRRLLHSASDRALRDPLTNLAN
jgi:hypothetical protein